MKRLYIVVEGDTEEEFVKTLLRPYFQSFGIYSVDATKITTNRKLSKKGGFVNYEHLRSDIKRLLRQPNVIVSMFVDFYALPDSVPGYEVARRKNGTEEQIKVLENAMFEDIDDHRFLPYIQRHEFESLLFASSAGFERYYAQQKDVMTGLERIFNAFNNPEDIDDGRETAPSKRILSIIPDYEKVVFGNIIALEIGLSTMLTKCPRFNYWLTRLIGKTTL